MDLTPGPEWPADRYDAARRALAKAWPTVMGHDPVFAEQVARVAITAADEFDSWRMREAFERAVATSRPVVLGKGSKVSVRVERRLPWWRRLFDRRRFDEHEINLGRSEPSPSEHTQDGGE